MAAADVSAAESGGAKERLWPVPDTMAGEATVTCGLFCPPGEAGPSACSPEHGAGPKPLTGERGLPGKVVSATCAALQAAVRRGARSIIDDAIVRANFPFRRAVLIGSEGCTASAFETCYGY